MLNSKKVQEHMARFRFYPNSLATAEEVVSHMRSGKRWGAVCGQTQAGKTEVMLAICEMYHGLMQTHAGHNNDVDYYTITGMNAKDYEPQVQDDIARIGVVNVPFIMRNHDLRKLKDRRSLRYKRLVDPNVTKVVIVDESMYGIRAESTLSGLFHGLLNLDFGSADIEDQLEARNIFLITTSATPYAEMVRIVNGKTQEPIPYVVLHHPGEGYYGLRDLIESGNLHDNTVNDRPVRFFDKKNLTLTDKGIAAIHAGLLCNSERKVNHGSIMLVRNAFACSNPRLLREALLKEFPNHNFRIETLGSRCDNDINSLVRSDGTSLLDYPPPAGVHQIVVINDMLRLAIRVPMHNVCMIYDETSNKTDIVTQSLAGRRTGYNKQFDDIPVFTNKQAVVAQATFWKDLDAAEGDQRKIRDVCRKFFLSNPTTLTGSKRRRKNESIGVIRRIKTPAQYVSMMRDMNITSWKGRNNKARGVLEEAIRASNVPDNFLDYKPPHHRRRPWLVYEGTKSGVTHIGAIRNTYEKRSAKAVFDLGEYDLGPNTMVMLSNPQLNVDQPKRIYLSEDYTEIIISQFVGDPKLVRLYRENEPEIQTNHPVSWNSGRHK